jgi:hypothetical protein
METCNTITWYLIRKTAVKISLLFQIPYSSVPSMTAPPTKRLEERTKAGIMRGEDREKIGPIGNADTVSGRGISPEPPYEKTGLRETSIRQGTLRAGAGEGFYPNQKRDFLIPIPAHR